MDRITRDTHPPATAVTVEEVDEDEAEELPPSAAAVDEADGRFIDATEPLVDAAE